MLGKCAQYGRGLTTYLFWPSVPWRNVSVAACDDIAGCGSANGVAPKELTDPVWYGDESVVNMVDGEDIELLPSRGELKAEFLPISGELKYELDLEVWCGGDTGTGLRFTVGRLTAIVGENRLAWLSLRTRMDDGVMFISKSL
jgi:hypothetical protein